MTDVRSSQEVVLTDSRRARVRSFYNAVNQDLDATEFGEYATFLNFGYVPTGNQEKAAFSVPRNALNRNCQKLVLEVAGGCDLNGVRLLDIGCGRGGTLQTLQRYFAIRCAFGVDFSSEAIAFCRRTRLNEKTCFVQADAELLPFANESLEVVTNIESSHGYPEREKFYAEVYRMLCPEGRFLYTDLLTPSEFLSGTAILEGYGFRMIRNDDITENVLLSCEQNSQRRTRAFGGGINQELLGYFLAVPGSASFARIRAHELEYRIFQFIKQERSTRQ